MARQLRPRTLAVGFGGFFLVMALVTWYFTSSLTSAWYGADLSRWAYLAYLLAGTILLGATGVVGVLRSQFLDRRIIQLNEQIDAVGGAGFVMDAGEALPPPLPEESPKDHVDRDIDDLLESLSEMESTATEVAAAADAGALETVVPTPGGGTPGTTSSATRDLVEKRDRARRMRAAVPKHLAGPAIGGVAVMAISGAMLPGSDGMLQTYHQVNTALILGIGYSWVALGGYFVAAVYALLRQK